MVQDAETWRAALGYEGFYEVSSLGRVRSIDRLVRRNNRGNTGCIHNQPGKVLSQTFNQAGYPRVHLSKEGVKRKVGVHFLVCEAFHGPRPAGMEVAHNDSNPRNPRANNLRWDTPKGNSGDRVANGTSPVGEKHPRARLTDEAVIEIRASSERAKVLAARYGIKPGTVYQIRYKQTWKHL